MTRNRVGLILSLVLAISKWRKVFLLCLALATHKRVFENQTNAPSYRPIVAETMAIKGDL